ncbi:Lipopolysaccharide kinase (Kdo/WaaP) family protein [Halopseudomonas xinjiangensis]|uniref:Lipopolysaccharide kinase (Kdo/WaaP) family protein n=1 Tax=Halopseudomonas xinjiangensis TaxID=487184 RepID=A0A1H1LZU9_9GAMM|nr:lipopolysaccharide kinase InaA family protein [Halopseudomonas xinjiangensis]SDR80104.1 Lipopolysaccharide kinase (Kdo/WaaP) family protein [Halopseudomonas xinjiangensis]
MKQVDMLRRAGRQPPLPLHLQLQGARTVHLTGWLRILPGKRLVGEGRLDGERVLVKLFIARGSARHFERELAGIEALLGADIPTPELLATGALAGGGCFMATRFIENAETLQARWEAAQPADPGSEPAFGIVSEAVEAVALLHQKGLVQTDMHLGNFLMQHDTLYVIDGDAIEAHGDAALPAAVAQHNLALLLGQLPPDWDACRGQLLERYLQVNPAHALAEEQVASDVDKVRQRRLADYLGKAIRDCTLFAVQRSWTRFVAVPRDDASRMSSIIKDPDCAFDGTLLKDGGSSTVATTMVDANLVVVKRYNIKGFSHWLKRFWRPSRAWHSWLAAHRLLFLGIATPKPLGMIESRFGPLRRKAWLVTEYCAGQDLLTVLGSEGERLPDKALKAALLRTVNALVAQQISHGDFKATNLIWNGEDLVLIDLDAMQAHPKRRGWQKAWQRDRARLVRNWPARSPLARWLEEHLPTG